METKYSQIITDGATRYLSRLVTLTVMSGEVVVSSEGKDYLLREGVYEDDLRAQKGPGRVI